MNKKVLVLGASGMLGHKLAQVLSTNFVVRATVRSLSPYVEKALSPVELIPGVSGQNFDSIVKTCIDFKPEVVINCIGIVKQLSEAQDPVESIEINALLPHRLAHLCASMEARFIHISTDCVFDGKQGNYTEDDIPTAYDLYGKSKALGEVSSKGCLTIRTSIIGRQLAGAYGLVEWFLAQREKQCSGYTQAIFSGLTTNCLAVIISGILAEHTDLSGLYHVSSEAISKFDLLKLINQAYSLNIDLVPDPSVVVDRSLDSTRFKQLTGIKIPRWTDMISQMFEDRMIYEQASERNLTQH